MKLKPLTYALLRLMPSRSLNDEPVYPITQPHLEILPLEQEVRDSSVYISSISVNGELIELGQEVRLVENEWVKWIGLSDLYVHEFLFYVDTHNYHITSKSESYRIADGCIVLPPEIKVEYSASIRTYSHRYDIKKRTRELSHHNHYQDVQYPNRGPRHKYHF